MGPDEGGSHVALGDEHIPLEGGAETVPGTAGAHAAERRVEEELAARAIAKSDLAPCRSMSLAGWELPDAFPTLRRLLEARMGKAGKREYVQVLRLVETFDLEVLHGAVKDALRLGAIGYDAVKHLVLCRIERRPPKLDLDIYPYLPRANVATAAAASYMSLLGGGAS